MRFLDGVFIHFVKPSLGEALSHHCNHASLIPMLQFAIVLLSGGVPGSRFRDLVVIGLFVKGLDVIVLL
jgi:hypothetical protein